MQRRDFLKNAGLAAASIAAPTTAILAEKEPFFSKNEPKPTFQLDYAPHDGMFKNSAGDSFLDQIRFMHEQGFRSIEDNGMMDRTPDEQSKIGELLAKLGMTMGVFVVLYDHWPFAESLTKGKKEIKDAWKKACLGAVETAKRTNAKWMTVVPGLYFDEIPRPMQAVNVIEALRTGCEIFEKHGLVMVLEPLSDRPDLFLRHSDQTFEICRAVNSPSCKILFDIYHMQRNEGRLIYHIDQCWDEIAYFQIGDEPARNEPTTGEINYRNVLKHIHAKGFRGVLGMEHGNSIGGKAGEMALIEAYRTVDRF